MSVQIVNYRNVRENIYGFIEQSLANDRPLLTQGVSYVFGLLELTVSLNGPRADDKAPRRQAKASAWGAILKGLGAEVDVPDEASLNALVLAVETHLVPHFKGYEIYGAMINNLPGWVAIGATPFAPVWDDVTN